ncbi:MAG: MgtC/SapB family protein [Acidobacteria bacterium]|nr:MgtC/SapB family protein [Acidobacteriota bacterium]
MDAWHEFWPYIADFVPKALLAVVCGGLIGVEREMKRKPAGFRTNILICLGSMLFMWLSVEVAAAVAVERFADPGRIGAQVVTGMGFLGAGTIIQSRGRITGLTSAAMIWLVAAVGMAIGAGHGAIGMVTTLLVLLVLVGLGFLERRVFGRCVFADCQVTFADVEDRTRREIDHVLRGIGRPIDTVKLHKSEEGFVLTIPTCDVHPQHKRFLHDLWRINGVQEVRILH